MKKTLQPLTTLLLATLLIACGAPDSGKALAVPLADGVTVAQNEGVDAQTRGEIQTLNSRLLNGFLENDDTAIRELFEAHVLAAIESGPGLAQVFSTVSKALSGTTTAPFHEFDITLDEPRLATLEVPADGNRGFNLLLQPTGTRIHVSLIEAKAEFRDHLVGLVYVQADDEWRLHSLRVGGLRALGKNAQQWHAEAQRLSQDGHPMPAAMRLLVAGGLLRPVPFLRYDTEADILALEQQVSSTLAETYAFPLELSSVPGPPKVLRLEPVFERGLLLTLVSYVTTQNLDQASINAEVTQVHAALTALLPDLCHQKGRVAYKAFAQPPVDETRSYPFINAVATCP